MRDSKDIAALAVARAEEMKKEKLKFKTNVIIGASFGFSLCAILILVAVVPNALGTLDVAQNPDTISAGIFAGSPYLAYAIIGIAAFILGVSVTTFCFYLKSKNEVLDHER